MLTNKYQFYCVSVTEHKKDTPTIDHRELQSENGTKYQNFGQPEMCDATAIERKIKQETTSHIQHDTGKNLTRG